MKHFNVFFLTILFLFCSIIVEFQLAYAGDDTFTAKDRELLIRIDERLNQMDKRFEQIDKRFEQIDKRFEQVELRISELREDMNKRFEQVDKHFEQIDKRFEQIDKRFEVVNKRFESLIQIMLGIIGAFAAIVAVTIGFALWDRRTMIRPFESKVKEIEENILEDRKRLTGLIRALKKLSEDDPKLASVLKNFSIL